MKKSIRSFQAGRSMIEVIAIVAVMGILLIAGLVGFRLLLDYLKQKETVEQVTTIGMRYKASRLNAKMPQKGYVPMDQVFPEGEKCNSNPECVITPEGGQVKLYSMGESKNFVVLVNQLKSTSCQELAMMGGYEFAFKSLNSPSSTSFDENFPRPSEIIKKGEDRTSFTFTNDNNEYVAFTPEYLKANPTVLKSFCDSNIPWLGFTYSADENCDYFYDGACHDCPSEQVQDDAGECCLDSQIDCGMCFGCGPTKKCLEEEQRCVECTENSDCPAGKFCSNNKCVTCEPPFYNLTTDGECTCVAPEQLPAPHTGEIGSECKEACNCKAGLMCIEGKCAECVIQPDCPGNVPCVSGKCKCDADNPCPTGQVCCNGTCCPAGQFCNAGVCSNCETNAQCDGNECCNGVCCAEGDICCNGQCCDKRCISVGGTDTCGGCDSDDDCPDNEYCDKTEGICKPCLNEYTQTCGDSVMETFNKKCYEKKHLNCLDETGAKDVGQLIQDTPNTEKPVCSDDENDSNAWCGKCSTTAECQALQKNGDKNRTLLNENTSTKVGNALFKDFVCRTQGTNEGTCGPCEVDGDCNDVPCFDGVCGCKTDTTCADNIKGTNCIERKQVCGCESDADCMTDEHLRTGKTKCNIDDNGVGTCGCDGGLVFDENLDCVCSTANEFWTRYTRNNAPEYLCCPKGRVATMAGTEAICVPMCEGNEYISVAMMLDYSWSGKNIKVKEGGKTFDSVRTQLASAFINGLKRINSDIRFGVFRENNSHTTNAQERHRCEGGKNNIEIQGFSTDSPDLNQSLCAFSNGQGETTFTDAINGIKNEFNGIRNECNANRENTIVLVLSDGMIPTNTATATGCKEENMYVYAAGEKSFGLGDMPHEMPFTATPTPDILLNMVADKICVNPSQMPSGLQPGYNPQNP